MIAALFALVVLLAGAVILLALLVIRSASVTAVHAADWRAAFAQLATGLVAQFAADQQANLAEGRAERAFLYRALISRTPGDFANLERIRNAGEAQRVGGRQMTREEFERWVNDDLQRMFGEDGERRDPEVPLVPEGFSG